MNRYAWAYKKRWAWYRCRCVKCERRMRSRIFPGNFSRRKICFCGASDWRVDWYRTTGKEKRARTCRCSGYHYPHRIRSPQCFENPSFGIDGGVIVKWKQAAPDVQVAPADAPIRYAVVYCTVPGFSGYIAWRCVKQRATRIGGFETVMLARLACESDDKKIVPPKGGSHGTATG